MESGKDTVNVIQIKSNTNTINTIIYNEGKISDGLDKLRIGQDGLKDDEKALWEAIKGYRCDEANKVDCKNYGLPKEYADFATQSRYLFDEVIYRMSRLYNGEWNSSTKLDIEVNTVNSDMLSVSFDNIISIITEIDDALTEYDTGTTEINLSKNIFLADESGLSLYDKLGVNYWNENAANRASRFDSRLIAFKEKNEEKYREIKNWDVSTFKDFIASGKDIDSFIKDKKEEIDGDDTNPGDPPSPPVIPYSPTVAADDQFNSSKTVEETNTNTETTDTGKTDTGKSDDNSSPDKGKTEPTKDTDTKDSDKTFENKPKPDNPPTISDNKGSSGVSHGGSSSNNGNGNYTFTNSGISASQDEPIEILTDEKPGDDQITSLPDDNEDIYTIPTDLSGVTSTKKHSSGGGSGVIPILGGLGAAAAVGVGAKIYMDNKKNNDNDEDSSESDDNTEDWNETSNENDGIIADEWNGDDSNFEFDDSEPNMDDDGSGFSEI